MALMKSGFPASPLCCGFAVVPVRQTGSNESNQSCVVLSPLAWLIKLKSYVARVQFLKRLYYIKIKSCLINVKHYQTINDFQP